MKFYLLFLMIILSSIADSAETSAATEELQRLVLWMSGSFLK